ncbi:site-specific integrase [Bradyrhizobium sp. dw_78]|uniref:tyrosine-type recombinase/integrase n=1 Tax=Bradyrhizobium sp. dw_78 TaxID=2719793 RepID=UPI001BD4F0D4|nr:site-specific integrase [Bradyrhizobium sp. dw_78]
MAHEGLRQRGSFWWFFRRTPKEYAAVEKRRVVQLSTDIRVADDPKAISARRKAKELDTELHNEWRMMLSGSTAEQMQEYRAARDAAHKLRISPPISNQADRDIVEAARRILAAHGANLLMDRPTALAVTDQAPKPSITFEECAKEYIRINADAWKNGKHSAQWPSTLEAYVYPHIGRLPVAEIGKEHVLLCIKPIWDARKLETFRRVRGRIESILDYASAHDYRSKENNPAQWKGNLSHIFPKSGAVKQTKHHGAMHFDEVPAFITRLQKQAGSAARALELTILTGLRTDAVLGGKWAEIDFEKNVWTIPAARSKRKPEFADLPHRVPLTPRMVALLKDLPRDGEYIFAGAAKGKPLSNMSMLVLLRRMKMDGITTHGFRSTFRDWAGEKTNHEDRLCEFVLGHVTSGTRGAYQRMDMLDKRRALMDDWGNYCYGAPMAVAA